MSTVTGVDGCAGGSAAAPVPLVAAQAATVDAPSKVSAERRLISPRRRSAPVWSLSASTDLSRLTSITRAPVDRLHEGAAPALAVVGERHPGSWGRAESYSGMRFPSSLKRAWIAFAEIA
ncbi:MAG TPA: hypothetical protein VF869_02145 [Jatrophihabitantaceae bacterium]